MTGYLILFIIMILLLIALYFAFKLYNKEKKERLKAEAASDKLRENIRILQDNISAVKEIKKQRINIDTRIKEAQTDEEVMDCISAVISANNSRL